MQNFQQWSEEGGRHIAVHCWTSYLYLTSDTIKYLILSGCNFEVLDISIFVLKRYDGGIIGRVLNLIICDRIQTHMDDL